MLSNKWNVYWKNNTGDSPASLPDYNIQSLTTGQLIEKRRLNPMECGVGMRVFTVKECKESWRELERAGEREGGRESVCGSLCSQCKQCEGSVTCITCSLVPSLPLAL